jgi:DNA-binding response OmpR family regulator
MAEGKLRVLVVDDDPDLLDLVARSLGAYGIEVSTHLSALGVATRIQESLPDVVLIDVNFPSLKGDKVVSLARSHAPSGTKFILYSASDEARLRALALTSGADGYLSKSVQGAELVQKIESFCHKPRPLPVPPL